MKVILAGANFHKLHCKQQTKRQKLLFIIEIIVSKNNKIIF